MGLLIRIEFNETWINDDQIYARVNSFLFSSVQSSSIDAFQAFFTRNEKQSRLSQNSCLVERPAINEHNLAEIFVGKIIIWRRAGDQKLRWKKFALLTSRRCVSNVCQRNVRNPTNSRNSSADSNGQGLFLKFPSVGASYGIYVCVFSFLSFFSFFDISAAGSTTFTRV